MTNNLSGESPSSPSISRGTQRTRETAVLPLRALTALTDPLLQAASNRAEAQVQQNRDANSLEHMRQSLLTMHTLISTMTAVGIVEEKDDSFSELGHPFTTVSPSDIRRKSLAEDNPNSHDSVESKNHSRADYKRHHSGDDLDSSPQRRPRRQLLQRSRFGRNGADIPNTKREDRTNMNTNTGNEAEDQVMKESSTAGDTERRRSNEDGNWSDGSAPNAASGESRPQSKVYFIGQWLDVRDTVNQWLEATVLQVEEVDFRLSRIFVHYNGWYFKDIIIINVIHP